MPGPLKLYDVEVNGATTTMRLSDEDARLMGLIVDEPEQAGVPEPEPEPETKAETPENKARAPRNKSAATSDSGNGGDASP